MAADSTDARRKQLEITVKALEKQFGKGAIMRLGDSDSLRQGVRTIPTGSLAVDIASGIGGYPRGRIIEIYGPESSGKTTLTLHAIAQVQRLGGVAAFIDAEHALDVNYARSLGVDVEDLLISQPDTGEQALEIADALIRSSSVDLVIIDSVAALTPRAELEGEMGDAHVGLQARLMSQALRKLTANINKSNTCLIFINQIRLKVGGMFGSPETTSGGNARKFYASMRVDIRRIGALKDGNDIVGNRTRVKIVKNKLAPPFREAEFDIMYGKGISFEADLLDIGSDIGVIDKTGSWYSYEGERLGQGRENAKRYLSENKGVSDRVEAQIRAHFDLNGKAASSDAAANDTAADAPDA